MKSFNAIRTDLNSLVIYFSPLEVGVASGLRGWIIMTAQKYALSDHYRTLTALFTFGGHIINLKFKYQSVK